MKTVFSALLLVLALTVPATAADPPVAQLTSLAWLTGSWVGTSDGTSMEEHWSRADGGVMTGMHRDVRDGKVRLFEFLRIQQKGTSLVYLAQPFGRPETAFPLVSLGVNEVTFANAAHDYPQRITYKREGDTLKARVEGTVNGKLESEEWTWTRGELAP